MCASWLSVAPLQSCNECRPSIDASPVQETPDRAAVDVVHGRGPALRVQRADDQYLSIAEVQVFETRAQTVANYEGGYTVPSMPISKPFQPQNRLVDLFDEELMDGVWTLTVRDSTKYSGAYSNGKLKDVRQKIQQLRYRR